MISTYREHDSSNSWLGASMRWNQSSVSVLQNNYATICLDCSLEPYRVEGYVWSNFFPQHVLSEITVHCCMRHTPRKTSINQADLNSQMDWHSIIYPSLYVTGPVTASQTFILSHQYLDHLSADNPTWSMINRADTPPLIHKAFNRQQFNFVD
jgi:hypothetical protein